MVGFVGIGGGTFRPGASWSQKVRVAGKVVECSRRCVAVAAASSSRLRCHLQMEQNQAGGVAMRTAVQAENGQASAQKRPVVFVLGGPGSGKGTQCEMLVEKYGWKQICAGELLRNEAKRETELGMMVKQIIDRGDIVPGYVTIELLEKEMARTVEETPGILIDGFPRAFDQAIEYEKKISRIDMVVYFSCSIETMRERLLGRSKTSGRADDVNEVIESRFRTFLDTSMPVIQKYREQGILNEVPSEGSPDEIFERLCVALRHHELLAESVA